MERGVSGRGACSKSNPNTTSQQHQRCNLVSTHSKLLLPKGCLGGIYGTIGDGAWGIPT